MNQKRGIEFSRKGNLYEVNFKRKSPAQVYILFKRRENEPWLYSVIPVTAEEHFDLWRLEHVRKKHGWETLTGLDNKPVRANGSAGPEGLRSVMLSFLARIESLTGEGRKRLIKAEFQPSPFPLHFSF